MISIIYGTSFESVRKFNRLRGSGADVPTVAETLPDFLTGSWQVLLAPAGTPRAIVYKVYAEVLKITGMPDVKE